MGGGWKTVLALDIQCWIRGTAPSRSTAAAPGTGGASYAQSPQAGRGRRPPCSSGSLQSLQVGTHDALHPAVARMLKQALDVSARPPSPEPERSEEHTSELQSRLHL